MLEIATAVLLAAACAHIEFDAPISFPTFFWLSPPKNPKTTNYLLFIWGNDYVVLDKSYQYQNTTAVL